MSSFFHRVWMGNIVALDTIRSTAALALLWSFPTESYDAKARLREAKLDKPYALKSFNEIGQVDRVSNSPHGLSYSFASKLRNSPQERIQEKSYDFVVVGNGSAGRSAISTLRELCPHAKIAVIDPCRPSNPDNHTDDFRAWVSKLDPLSRRLCIQNFHANDPATATIHYRHSVLIATGSRGAPPPNYLIDEEARNFVLELRPSVLPSGPQQRPVLSMEDVRNHVLAESTKGKHLVVLGSGWEAIDLAASIALRNSPKAGQGSGSLVFGSAAPLGHVLPRYLGTAVSKRLRSRKVSVHDRTLVRYISHAKGISTSNSLPGNRLAPLQLFTANSSDLLDTSTFNADWIVVAPGVSGPQGNSAIPTDMVPPSLQESRGGRSWYQPWSLLAASDPGNPTKLACYRGDGRVVVNAELQACDGVYATGSAAKFPNGLSGHASVASVGVEDGAEAGKVAAWNMTRQYHLETSQTKTSTKIKDPIPVFRSDRLSYSSEGTSLSAVGIRALCVGDCDAEQFFTHGVWWTNLAAQRRLLSLGVSEPRDTHVRRRQSKMIKNGVVYGLGVVYYIDRLGRIRGIMTWGLPFSSGPSNHINQTLVSNLKAMIAVNVEHENRTDYLTQVSRRFVKTAFAGLLEREEHEDPGTPQSLRREMDSMLRPLHRFTEPRPADARRWGLLKRQDGVAHVSPGDDLFATVKITVENQLTSRQNSGPSGQGHAMSEWKLWELTERQWELNEEKARPLKEDLIWLRKGDEMRYTSARENLRSAYNKAIWSS